MGRDKRKGIIAGYKKAGPLKKFSIKLSIVGIVLSFLYFLIPHITNSKQSKLNEPILKDSIKENDQVNISFGNIEKFSMPARSLKGYKDKGLSFIQIDGINPIKLWINDLGEFKVNVELYNWKSGELIEVISDTLYNLPPRWDRNSNRVAYEIVNEDKLPIFQLIYKDPNTILINGLFATKDNIYIADNKTGRLISKDVFNQFFPRSIHYHVERLFQYPSLSHPGKLR